MLLKFYHQSYQELLDKLLQLQKQVREKDIDMMAINTIYNQGQDIFKGKILSVKLDDLDCNAIILIQSAQTEINKNLRLLGTELLFLASSRQAGTTQKRLEKVQGIIEQLIGYCQAIIKQVRS
ncbi:MAG: heterocyst frequency control protein PatD [Crocosphaera sp.]